MPEPILFAGAVVLCSHGGTAAPTGLSARVRNAGAPVVTVGIPYVVAGCGLAGSGSSLPCSTGQFLSGTTRVLADGVPVAIATGQSVCSPSGTPLIALAPQTRALAG